MEKPIWNKQSPLVLAGVTPSWWLAFLQFAQAPSQTQNSGSSNTFNYIYETGSLEILNYLTSSKLGSYYRLDSQCHWWSFRKRPIWELSPSMAEEWTVSPDGKTYTTNFCKDAKWVYFRRWRVRRCVTAEDFVTGLKYAADTNLKQSTYSGILSKGLRTIFLGRLISQK